MEAALELINVTKTYSEANNEQIIALNNASVTINYGELVAIVGPSGSGKSTFLSISGALLRPTCGTVKVGGIDLENLGDNQLSDLRLDKVGFILQSSNLIPYLTTLNQLLIIKQMSKCGKVTNNDIQYAKKILSELGLSAQLKKYPAKLSGGQKQRVAIARALFNNPDIILADEPTASLDFEKATEVVEQLKKQTQSTKKAIVMVTHDERMLSYCDRIFSITDGTLTEITTSWGIYFVSDTF